MQKTQNAETEKMTALFKFKRLRREDVQLVGKWRCLPHVTRYMKTDICPDLLEQIEWFDRKPHNFYWMIHFGDKPIGLINLADMQPQHRRTGFGFYIGEQDHCHLGGMVLPYFYNYVFNTTGFERIYAEVFSSNLSVYHIHCAHGYHVVGTYRDHIYKNGESFDVDLMTLDKKKWLANSRYSSFIAEFE